MLHVSLDLNACRTRQQRLRARLREQGLDTALIMDRRLVHYFTGYWHYSSNNAVAAVLPVVGPVTVIAPTKVERAADQSLAYEANKFCTLVDDQVGALLAVARPLLAGAVGCDWRLPETTDLKPILYALWRAKDPDEVAMIRKAIACCDAAYAAAKDLLQPGVTETHLYARLLAAASEEAGEPIGEFGNDFQSGTPGGLPRQRAVEEGEMAIYDLTAIYRGYCCDLCRSFVVGGKPSDAQREAYRLINAAFIHIEHSLEPGMSCRALYEEVHDMLDGKHGWSFSHHLGHGIGLNPHEAPRLNPNWDDVFQPGDTFTAEPGLYGEELKGGIRIEQNYLVTETGLERLSHFPTEIA
ncbi:MAG: M24 family metallopeptidase [Armatimonadota bacterium]